MASMIIALGGLDRESIVKGSALEKETFLLLTFILEFGMQNGRIRNSTEN